MGAMAIGDRTTAGDSIERARPRRVPPRANNPHVNGDNLMVEGMLPVAVRDEMESNRRARTIVRQLGERGAAYIDKLLPDASYFNEDAPGEGNVNLRSPAQQIRYMKYQREQRGKLSEEAYYAFILKKTNSLMLRGYDVHVIAKLFEVTPHTADTWMRTVKKCYSRELKNMNIGHIIAESLHFYKEMRYAATAILNKSGASNKDKLYAIRTAIHAEDAQLSFLDKLHAFDDYKIVDDTSDNKYRDDVKEVVGMLKQLVTTEEELDIEGGVTDLSAADLLSDNDDTNYLR